MRSEHVPAKQIPGVSFSWFCPCCQAANSDCRDRAGEAPGHGVPPLVREKETRCKNCGKKVMVRFCARRGTEYSYSTWLTLTPRRGESYRFGCLRCSGTLCAQWGRKTGVQYWLELPAERGWFRNPGALPDYNENDPQNYYLRKNLEKKFRDLEKRDFVKDASLLLVEDAKESTVFSIKCMCGACYTGRFLENRIALSYRLQANTALEADLLRAKEEAMKADRLSVKKQNAANARKRLG